MWCAKREGPDETPSRSTNTVLERAFAKKTLVFVNPKKARVLATIAPPHGLNGNKTELVTTPAELRVN